MLTVVELTRLVSEFGFHIRAVNSCYSYPETALASKVDPLNVTDLVG